MLNLGCTCLKLAAGSTSVFPIGGELALMPIHTSQVLPPLLYSLALSAACMGKIHPPLGSGGGITEERYWLRVQVR